MTKDKTTGIAKAMIAGALFGGAVGLVTAPKHIKSKKHSFKEDTGKALKVVGVAMQDMSDILKK